MKEYNIIENKSYLIRCLIASFLSSNNSTLVFSKDYGQDVSNLLKTLLEGGLSILGENAFKGGNFVKNANIYANNGGTILRVLLPIYIALGISGKIYMSNRLMDRAKDFFSEIINIGGEINIIDEGDEKIVQFGGRINQRVFKVDLSNTSQYLSGLLFALPLLKEKSIINITNVTSLSFIRMTIDILKKSGIKLKVNRDYSKIIIYPSQYHFKGTYVIKDLSLGSFFICKGIIKEDLKLNIGNRDLIFEREIIKDFKRLGGKIKTSKKGMIVYKSYLKEGSIDLVNYPDYAMCFSGLAPYINGTTTLKNLSKLKLKESDRISSIINNLKEVGIESIYNGGDIIIYGGDVHGGNIKSYNDHRVYMMGAVLSLISKEEITFDEDKCVEKSFPRFIEEFKG